ncbi:hypothetical protein QBC43DRAFT_222731 [Cladorrhinum sp. PSN259]|nr:hypothetical protein QBC43DRAFT_222731 [Cladorrhinum sp. PSN259]
MDEEFFEARNKYLKRKPETSGHKMTHFQRMLRKNPYAMALATPSRRDAISACTLPAFFLQRFKLVKHPETDDPWFVPQGLDKPERMLEGTPCAPEESHDSVLEENVAAEESDSPVTTTHPSKHPKGVTPGPSAYTLNSRRLLQGLLDENKSSPYKGQYRKLLRMNDGGSGRLKSALNNARWRADMDSVLLDTMRKRIVERLLECATTVERRGRKYLQPCTWDNVHGFNHRGCLVYLGKPQGSSESAAEADLPRLSALTVKGRKYGGKIAVHDLRVLLGAEYINQLRQDSSLLRDNSLFLVGRTATQPLQLLLWKLQGYISLDQPEDGSGSQQ